MTNKEFEDLTYQEKIKYNLPAIIAFANGEAIESTSLGTNDYFNVYSLNYIHKFPHRIQVKTVKRWYNLYLKSFTPFSSEITGYGFSTKEEADKNKRENRIHCLELEATVEV